MEEVMEQNISKPLIAGMTVEVRGVLFKVGRWFKDDKHCYSFTQQGKDAFYKRPSDVVLMIKKKEMRIVSF